MRIQRPRGVSWTLWKGEVCVERERAQELERLQPRDRSSQILHLRRTRESKFNKPTKPYPLAINPHTLKESCFSPFRSRVKPVDSIAVDEEEGEFPRGGKEALTPLEKRLIKHQAQQDLLFGEVN